MNALIVPGLYDIAALIFLKNYWVMQAKILSISVKGCLWVLKQVVISVAITAS
jgi:hypothetical protein